MRKLFLLIWLFSFLSLAGQEKDTTISIHFENNKFQPDSKQEADLAAFSPSIYCIQELIGYADTVASADYNLQLSKKRVDYILSILKSALFCDQYKVHYK